MIVVVPLLIAATVPVADPMVPTAVLLLIHVPPDVVFVNVVDDPSQRTNVPAIAAGFELTVAMVVLLQPVASVYVIFDVPAVTPVRAAFDEPIVATAVVLLLQVPPAGVALSVVVIPIHVCVVPLITDGRAFTVTSFVD